MLRTLALSTLACVAATSVGEAQSHQLEPLRKSRSLVRSPAGQVAPIGRAIVVDYNNDCSPDLAFVTNDTLHVATSPDVWSWFDSTPLDGVTDVAALRHACGDLTDIVLVVGPGGTRITARLNGGFRIIPLAGFDTIRRIDACNHGGEYFLLGADEADVLHLATWALGSNISVQATVHVPGAEEFVLADWDGDGDLDAVVRTQTDLVAYDYAGNLIGSVPAVFAGSGGSIARVRTPTGDQIAWMSRNASGQTWRLRVLEAGVELVAFPLQFGPQIPGGAAAVNIAAGDYDGDGFDDLAYLQNTTRHVAVLPHQGTLPPFDANKYFLVDAGTRSPDQDTTALLFADINNDTHPLADGSTISQLADLVLMLPSRGTIDCFVELRGAVQRVGQQPAPPGGGSSSQGLPDDRDYPPILASTPVMKGGAVDELTLDIERPSKFQWATDLQVVVWRQDNVLYDHEIKLERHERIRWIGERFQRESIQLDHAFSSTGQWTKDQVYFLMLRFIERVNGAMTQASPCYLFGVSVDADTSITPTWLLDYYLREISDDDPSTEDVIDVSRHVGVIKKRGINPPTQTQSIPDPGAPQ